MILAQAWSRIMQRFRQIARSNLRHNPVPVPDKSNHTRVRP
jgi:hypothetical protein